MGMSLSDIEAKAEDLANRLLAAGKSEAMLIGFQIAGLRDLAQIKAVGDQRAQWNASVGMREEDSTRRDREIAAMEAVAAKVPETAPAGQCFNPAPTAIGKPSYPVCTLKHGHAGAHSDGTSMRWTNADPSKCGHRWQWFESSDLQRFEICTLPIGHDGGHLNQVTGEVPEEPAPAGVPPCPSTFQRSKDEYYVCTLEYQHEGQHRGGGMWWSGPGNGKQVAEPTKPAADRLHELVSYCARQSNDAHLEAEQETESMHRRLQIRERAAAYADVGQKLQDILTEGSI